ncbi:hypothetical protein DKX38_021031 [Salix brachista]|uniref:Uncharacterized protein n=1 Tax=Salix brachista TaxID=2182728 RepID=A0A5N5K9E3_9ROSI|nr:hypothetical protein DKX38_021031 [Salix brachista]
MAQKPHVAIFPSPGMGHLIPLTELAKKLALSYDLSSTFIVPSIGPPPEAQTKVLGSLPAGINYISLPPVSFDDLPGIRAETQISLTITRSLSSIRDVLKSLVASTRLVALVLDLFGTDVIDIAMEFSVPSYIASLSTGMTLSLHFYMPKLDQMVSCEYRDLPEPVLLPGCATPVHGRDLPDPIQDRKDDAYKWFLHHSSRHSLAEGILLNCFMDLEPETIKALQDQELGNLPPIYPVGPIINSGSSIGVNGHECLQWMDDQPHGSVLYISFGSGGTLSFEQLNELAMGLEIILLSAGLKVALRPEVDGNGLVGREEIAKVVKGLMQGGEGVAIRNRMKGLKEAAAKAVSEEGSSTKSLHELVSKWKN